MEEGAPPPPTEEETTAKRPTIGKFYAKVNKMCSKLRVFCLITTEGRSPQFFYGDPAKHCTRTWLSIEQTYLSYQDNQGAFPRGNPDGFKKRALGSVQETLYDSLITLLEKFNTEHAPCYIVLQDAKDRLQNRVFKAGLWERLPMAQAVEMALAFIPTDDKTKKPKEARPAAIKCVDNGEVITVLATKRLRKLLETQWPRHHYEGKSMFRFRLEDYPGVTLDSAVKRIRRWEELIKDGKEVKIIPSK